MLARENHLTGFSRPQFLFEGKIVGIPVGKNLISAWITDSGKTAAGTCRCVHVRLSVETNLFQKSVEKYGNAGKHKLRKLWITKYGRNW